jgi:catechol 2,3-dioxygenase-like lactoylglutathione lyase family enzyme
MTNTESATNPVMKLELVPVPVADLDRAKSFYTEKLGFNADHDTRVSETVRVVQLTPHGSACSIVISMGLGEISDMTPGLVKGLHLVVKDIDEVRDLLIGRGVAVSDIVEYPRAIKFAYFSDPDGNSWALQEIPPNL